MYRDCTDCSMHILRTVFCIDMCTNICTDMRTDTCTTYAQTHAQTCVQTFWEELMDAEPSSFQLDECGASGCRAAYMECA